MADALKYDFTGLNNFIRSMDASGKLVVKVGIFGNKNARSGKAKKGGAMSNAEIGMVHEFGSFKRNIPVRSFLRMPIAEKSKEIIADASKGAMQKIAAGNLRGVLAELGRACEKWIQGAFASRGFGRWKPDAPATAKRKGSDAVLIDTAQLRRSIASKVDAQ